MVDLNSIALSLESLSALSTISRELLGLVKSKDISGKIGEMNAIILETQQFALSAQSDQLSLSKRISDLEDELTRLRDFRTEKENYQLQALGKTAFAYVHKNPVDSGNPQHWLCSTCYDQDRKSLLQFYSDGEFMSRGLAIWKCNVCKSEIRVPANISP